MGLRQSDLTATQITHFLSKFEEGAPDECWRWRGSINGRTGYGQATDGVPAHRISYAYFVADIPDRMHVMHECSAWTGRESRSCVNFRHLRLGSARENNRQALIEGSRSRALTWDDVHAIRAAWSTGTQTAAELARRYGVHEAHVRNVVKNRAFYDPYYNPRHGRGGRARLWSDAQVSAWRERYWAGNASIREIQEEAKGEYSTTAHMLSGHSYAWLPVPAVDKRRDSRTWRARKRWTDEAA